jgi:cytochrome P450
MNMDKDVWGENASEFIPERWITPDGVPPKSELPPGWKGIMTFHAGPRNCIGYRLG